MPLCRVLRFIYCYADCRSAVFRRCRRCMTKKSFADEPELFLQFVVFANYPTKDDEKIRENVSKRDNFLEGRSKGRYYKHHFCVIYTFE